MDNRKYLWDRAETLLLKLRGIKSPMQNEVKFIEDEIFEFANNSLCLCADLECLINDIQIYMKDNEVN